MRCHHETAGFSSEPFVCHLLSVYNKFYAWLEAVKMYIVREPLPSASRSTCKDGIIVSALPAPLLGQLSASENKGASLPAKRHFRLARNTRHTFLTVYRRLFSFVFIGNLIGLGLILALNVDSSSPPLSDFAIAASANMMVAILIRQDYIVNILFKTCSLVPLSAPLRFRRLLAKVYEYGGVHSGAAFCSVVWFLVLTTFLTKDFVFGRLEDIAVMAFTYILLTLLLGVVITAYPGARFVSHNTFENVHRWGGWASLLLFWPELVLFANSTAQEQQSKSLVIILIQLPAFWLLFISSIHVILPWLRFHKISVQAEYLSNHVIRLHFKEMVLPFVTLRISDAPLREWHSFACIPDLENGGGSMLISDAGDWTRKTIQAPKEYYYIKGVPVIGVLCMAQIFRKVVVVTTGSGIGPCLGTIQDIPKTACRVVWSTPSPWQTYGEEICNAVLRVDTQAVIIDTRVTGRPNLVELAYGLYIESQAEAVFCISNRKLTRKVVYGMESRGVPAFGPIWDS
jgi:hypothetical protein